MYLCLKTYINNKKVNIYIFFCKKREFIFTKFLVFLFAIHRYNDISDLVKVALLYILAYTMKKPLLSLVAILAFSSIALGVVNAELEISTLFSEGYPLVDDAYTQLLNDYDGSWWYSGDIITCEVDKWITITTPTVEDSTIDVATTYDLFVSPYRISQIKDWDSSIDTSKIIMKKVEINNADENVKFELSADEFDSNTAYYGFISPVDWWDGVGTPTKEICFKMSNSMCLQDTACEALNTVVTPNNEEVKNWVVEEHGAASDCVWMDMANVTHVLNGDVLTLIWTAVDGDTVEIAIFDPTSEVYKSLWQARMSDEKFEYKMKWDGEQNFKLTNGCKDLYYKADAKRWEPESEIKVTPATGPAENVLYVAIAAIVLYGAYVVFFRKSEN